MCHPNLMVPFSVLDILRLARADALPDILIANGARRMDRQDAVGPVPKPKTAPAGGLPVSPHPPRQHSPAPQALPGDFDPYAAHADRTSIEADRSGYGGVTDQAALYATHSPETSGSVDAHEAVTPEEGADLARFPSWKRKPVPTLDESTESAQEHEGQAEAPTLGPVVPPKSGSRPSPETPPKSTIRTEILSPSPTKSRDTIHNIVDIYNRDSVPSNSTGDFEPSSEYGESPRKSKEYTYGSHQDHQGSSGSRATANENGTGNGAGTGNGGGNEEGHGKRYDTTRLTPPDERDDEVGEMRPPGVMFDLTPGREPSPARYKHGEPLSFGKSQLCLVPLVNTSNRAKLTLSQVGEEEEGDQ